MTDKDCSININNDTLLAGSDDRINIVGADLVLAGANLSRLDGIWINGNNLRYDIRLDPILKFHDLDGKYNAKGIYHNKITPHVESSIHFYQVRKKG